MKEEKICQIAKLIYKTVPQLRKDYIAPAREADDKIPKHALFCLFILQSQGTLSMRDLASRLGVSSQQLTRIVGDLETNGFVARATDGSNRRLVNVHLTKQGEQIAAFHAERAMNNIKKKFGVLTEEELDAFLYHMRELIRLTQKTEELQ